MPFGFYGAIGPLERVEPRHVGRPDRGNRSKVKAGRRAAKRAR